MYAQHAYTQHAQRSYNPSGTYAVDVLWDYSKKRERPLDDAVAKVVRSFRLERERGERLRVKLKAKGGKGGKGSKGKGSKGSKGNGKKGKKGDGNTESEDDESGEESESESEDEDEESSA